MSNLMIDFANNDIITERIIDAMEDSEYLFSKKHPVKKTGMFIKTICSIMQTMDSDKIAEKLILCTFKLRFYPYCLYAIILSPSIPITKNHVFNLIPEILKSTIFNSLELLNLLFTETLINNDDFQFLKDDYIDFIRNQQVLIYLFDNYPLFASYIHNNALGILTHCLDKGEFIIANWLIHSCKIDEEDIVILFDKLSKISFAYHIDALHWLLNSFINTFEKVYDNNQLILFAIQLKCYDIITYIINTYGIVLQNDIKLQVLYLACHGNNTENLQWFCGVFNITIEDIKTNNFAAFLIVCLTSNLQVIRWMIDKFNITPEDIRAKNNGIIYSLIKHNKLSILKYFEETCDITADDINQKLNKQFFRICREGRKDMLIWMNNIKHDYPDISNREQCMEGFKLACLYGNLEFVIALKCLLSITLHEISQRAEDLLQLIACKGNLKIILWFIDSLRMDSFRVSAHHNIVYGMGMVHGDYNNLSWILSKVCRIKNAEELPKTIKGIKPKKCTAEERIWSLAWFFKNFSHAINKTNLDEFYTFVLSLIVKRNHLSALQWLSSLTDSNLYVGDLPLPSPCLPKPEIKCLYGTRLRHISRSKLPGIFSYPCKKGYLEVLQCLFKIFGSVDKIEDLFMISLYNGHLHIVQWIHDNFTLDKEMILTTHENIIIVIISKGYLHVLQWFIATFSISVQNVVALYGEEKVYNLIRKYQHIHIYRWLYK